MITDNEMRIANTSYINKDFAQIYPELLGIFKSLTSKYDPTTSNESDPGVVLLKLLGFVADKLNYNVDKNVLECFAPSATQESSMRRILSPLGYEMGYYHGATTDVQFTYTDDSKFGSDSSFKFNKYETILTNDDESVQFVLLDDVVISAVNEPFVGEAIQGRKGTLTSGDSETLLLESLDSNNRIYFPVGQVAENGVWVRNADSDTPWERVGNLNSQTPGSLVYRFGYDSSMGLPYIEFPNDISSIIGNGLNVDYIICDGASGNISAKTLTKLSSPTSGIEIKNPKSSEDAEVSFSDEDGNDLLTIKNLSASVDGADPETLDEAYNNFKKTIGTFDTLVTCRDYANAIYNLENAETGSNVVSNCQVTDRRDDLTRSTRVVSYDEYGQKEVNVKNSNNSEVEPNDLFLYPLKPLRAYTKKAYADSFKPLDLTSYIENELEGSKSASHDYAEIGKDSLYCLKNYLGIKANISTTYKVNSYERAEIISNAALALIKRFNARNVDYGQEIPYDSILEAIEGADKRISSVSLEEPTLHTVAMAKNSDEKNLISSDGLDFLLTILARNVLAGRVALFDYDEDFNYDFGQTYTEKLTGLAKISTEAKISLPAGASEGKDYGYKLLDNEVIQVIAPSLVPEIQYVAYTLYRVEGVTGSIPANTNHLLSGNERLIITYTDSSTSQVVTKAYTAGSIIFPSIKLENTLDDGSGTTPKTVTIDGKESELSFKSLGASETIEVRHLNQKEFGSATYFYWIRSNPDNKLFTESDKTDDGCYEAILGDGEYLFYTDSSFTSLASLGSGTTIKTNLSDATDLEAPSVEYEEIYEEGLLSLKDKWKRVPLTKATSPKGTYILVSENKILTLASGDTITTSKAITLGNDLQDISGTVKYSLSGASEEEWEGYEIAEASTRIKSRLDIDSGPDNPQSKDAEHQTLEFGTKGDDNKLSLSVGQRFCLSSAYQFTGANSIDTSSLDLVTGEKKYPFSVFAYTPQTVDGEEVSMGRDANGYTTLGIDLSKELSYDVPKVGDEPKALMVFVRIADEGTKVTITSDQDKGISWLNQGDELSKSLTLSYEDVTTTGTEKKVGIRVIYMTKDVGHLKFSSTGKANITLDYIKYLKRDEKASNELSNPFLLNPQLGLTDEVASIVGEDHDSLKQRMLDKVNGLDDSTTKQFYYTCRVDNAKAIEAEDMTEPEALYDTNNVACKSTISEIDISNLGIDVVRSSRL